MLTWEDISKMDPNQAKVLQALTGRRFCLMVAQARLQRSKCFQMILTYLTKDKLISL